MADRYVKIFGERNSGTKILRELLARNASCTLWPGTIPEIGPAHQAEVVARRKGAGREATLLHESVQDEIYERLFEQSLGWKHAVPALERMRANPRFGATSFAVIVKNPYAWLLSMFRNPWHNLTPGNLATFGEFLRRPWLTVRRENAPASFDTPIDLWNHKYRAYLEFAQRAPVCILKYEELLEDPSLIARIGGVELRSREGMELAPSFDTYRAAYRGRFWLKDIEASDRALIDARLDRDVVQRLGY